MQTTAESDSLKRSFIIALIAGAALTGLIAALGPLLARVPHLPDQGPA